MGEAMDANRAWWDERAALHGDDGFFYDIVGFLAGERQVSDRELLSLFVSQNLGTLVSKENSEDLPVLKELIEDGKVTPGYRSDVPTQRGPEAMRQLEKGHARGKVVIAA